jgi:hypothetical protein
MKSERTVNTTYAGASYAALRHGGRPPLRAQAELGLDDATALRLERTFLARPVYGLDAMRPRFARHSRHVRSVRAQGGFPVLPERRR